MGAVSLGSGLTLGRWGVVAGVAPAPAAPGVVEPPRITGSGRIGEPLSALPGIWSGVPAPVLSRQWLRDGAAIPGATGAAYLPRPEDDLCEITCRIEGANPHGVVGVLAPPLIITQIPPGIGTLLADLTLPQDSGVYFMPSTEAFTGGALSFSVRGDGVTIDPASGVLSVQTDALASGLEIEVTATNSGGSASQTFRLTVATVEPEATAPAVVTGPSLAGSGVIGTAVEVDPGSWSGTPTPVVSLQWQRDGADIGGATDAVYVPGPDDDRAALRCVVTATNSAGAASAETAALAVTYAAPVAAGGLADARFVQGSGAHTIDAGADFSSGGLVFAVAGAGAEIDAVSGVVSIETDDLRDAVLVLVTASNSGGAAESSFRVTVAAAEPAEEAPAVIWPPLISGTGIIGTVLSVDPGVWSGVPEPVLLLQWLRDGAEIVDATAEVYAPSSADDCARLSFRVTASNAAGSQVAVTEPILVVRAAPTAGLIADVEFVRGSGPQTVAAGAVFGGDALVFSVDGVGAEIDPDTGVVSILTDVLRAGELITVRAANSGGSAAASFRVTVGAEAPDEVVPVLVAAPSLSGSGVIGTTVTVAPGVWSGDPEPVIRLQWRRNGTDIAGATGTSHLVTGVDDRAALSCVVTASNTAGSATAETEALTVTRTAPVVVAALADLKFDLGSGVRTVSAQAAFAGEGLLFSLDAAAQGVTIDAGSGLVSVATDRPLAATTVTVRAENSGGSVRQSFTVEILARGTVFDNAASLGEVTFHDDAGAPSWTYEAEGYARLVPAAAGGAYGDWSGAGGDGVYRCLARWSNPGPAQTQFRPFAFGVNTRKEGRHFNGIRLDVYEATPSNRQIQFRQFTGSSNGTLPLGTGTAVAWSWNTWYWVEVEVAGPDVRARLYPEGAQAPAWQVVVSAPGLVPGGFGPGGISRNGQSPVVEIRRLEFTKPSHEKEIPPAVLDSEWDIAQFTERT